MVDNTPILGYNDIRKEVKRVGKRRKKPQPQQELQRGKLDLFKVIELVCLLLGAAASIKTLLD